MNKAADAFRTISEVADELEVQKHVLRFWENKFPQLHPMKRGGGRRYYRPEDMDLLRGIQHLLRNEGYTIKGVQKILREQGVEEVKRSWQRPGASKGAATEGKSASAGRKASASARGEARGRAQSTAAARESATRRAIAAAIRELEVCHRLLNEPPASGASSRASARARQRG